jgi:hypothetical protein
MNKKRKKYPQHIRHTIELIRSPAMRVLSRAGHKLLMYAESELARHAGKDNGRIPVTKEALMGFGLYRHGIAATFREVHALGLGDVEHGRGGNAEYRRPNFIRLTYLPSGANKEIPPTDEWRAVTTIERAEAIAQKARASKHFSAPKNANSRPLKQGLKNGRFRPLKQGPTAANSRPLKQGLLSRYASHVVCSPGESEDVEPAPSIGTRCPPSRR